MSGQAPYGYQLEPTVVEGIRTKKMVADPVAADHVRLMFEMYAEPETFIAGDTVIIFDELQEFPDIATALKSFRIDGRFDVICSGFLLGINYRTMMTQNSKSIIQIQDC